MEPRLEFAVSEFNERADDERYELMWLDEYSPAAVYEEDGLPDFLRPFRDRTQGSVPDGSYAARKDLKILAGECGMPACSGRIDSVGFCELCGQISRVGGSRGEAALTERRAA